MQAGMQDYYEILGVAPDASADDIRRAFRARAKMHHPDTMSGTQEAMVQLNEAYETLRDPVRRTVYNARRHQATVKVRVPQATRIVDPDVFLARIFQPADREISIALGELDRALADLAYDPYDEPAVERFGASVEGVRVTLARAAERLNRNAWPGRYSSALNLYSQGVRQVEDALADFRDYVTCFDTDLVVEGQAIVAGAVELMGEARERMPAWR